MPVSARLSVLLADSDSSKEINEQGDQNGISLEEKDDVPGETESSGRRRLSPGSGWKRKAREHGRTQEHSNSQHGTLLWAEKVTAKW